MSQPKLAAGTNVRSLPALADEPSEGVATVLEVRLAELIACLQKAHIGAALGSAYLHSAGLLDRLCVIEHGPVEEGMNLPSTPAGETHHESQSSHTARNGPSPALW